MIKHLVLPSGGWWDIETNPKWGKIRSIDRSAGDNAILAALTEAWSFSDPVTPEAIDERDLSDMVVVMGVVMADVLPLFSQLLALRQQGSIPPFGKAE